MEPIRNFDQLTSHLKTLNKRKRIAVVCANDPNTEYAIKQILSVQKSMYIALYPVVAAVVTFMLVTRLNTMLIHWDCMS